VQNKYIGITMPGRGGGGRPGPVSMNVLGEPSAAQAIVRNHRFQESLHIPLLYILVSMVERQQCIAPF
jgi:hypothetical protein